MPIKNVFFDHNDVDYFVEKIFSNFKNFYAEHKKLFKFREKHQI